MDITNKPTNQQAGQIKITPQQQTQIDIENASTKISKLKDKIKEMHGLKLSTISLSIIVKNEEKVITRLLESVAPILDYYVIVDTGSTDNTKQVIKDFFDNLNIPGEIIDHEWVNFETARNFALENTKGKADFGFWIDADEQLVYDADFKPEVFKASLTSVDMASVEVHYGETKYTRAQFFKTSMPFKWHGPVHEILVCDDNTAKHGIVKGFHVLVRPDGSSWTEQSQKDKYEAHAKLLEEYIKDPAKKEARWVFYLAQSYRDATGKENYYKAIHWYRERVKMGGFPEEVYFSQYMIGVLYTWLNKSAIRVIDELMKCSEFDQMRAEHLVPIIQQLQRSNRWEESYILSKYAYDKFHDKYPYPQRVLFLDEQVYQWKIADLHSIGCYYTRRKDEAKQSYAKLMEKIKGGFVPMTEIERIEKNGEFFNK